MLFSDQYFIDDLKDRANVETKAMNLLRIYLIAVLFLTFAVDANGQETAKAVLVDEFGKLCSEELMARYDAFLAELSNHPTSDGLIAFYGDRNVEGRNLKMIRWLGVFYPRVRGFEEFGVKVIRGEDREKMLIQFWRVPHGQEMPTIPAFKERGWNQAAQMFDQNWADFNRWEGKLDIYSDGFYDLGCEFSPNVPAFVRMIRNNSSLTGHIVVYTKYGKGKNYGEKIARFARNDIVRNYKVSPNRIRTVYAGNRAKSEIELWLVPEGKTLTAK